MILLLLLLVLASGVCVAVVWDDFMPPRTPHPHPVTRHDVLMQPRIDGMVHYLGLAGRAILIESPRGIELEITGDTITLDEALDYLAEVDAL